MRAAHLRSPLLGALRALGFVVPLLALAVPAGAEPREVGGQAGFLGEWELTATVTERVESGTSQLIGPLSLKHVGVCSSDGPEEKTGELRLRLSGDARDLKATLLIDGAECTYKGQLKESYDGLMNCPNRRAVPLSLWIR
jgi:hypothetical protein